MAIYMWREKPEWHPWADTIVYYPLEWNWNDLSWNWKNLTTTSQTFATDGSLTYASYAGSQYSYSPTLTIPSTYTILTWAKVTIQRDGGCSLHSFDTYNRSYWYRSSSQLSMNFTCQLWESSYSAMYVLPTLNQWYLYAYVKNSTGYKLYALSSGTPLTDTMSSSYNGSFSLPLYLGSNTTSTSQRLYWWISKFIIEWKEWTEQNITDYFNQTKADYWIS